MQDKYKVFDNCDDEVEFDYAVRPDTGTLLLMLSDQVNVIEVASYPSDFTLKEVDEQSENEIKEKLKELGYKIYQIV